MAHTRDDVLSPSLRTAGGVGRAGTRLRSALVVAEMAIAIVLLAGSGVLVKSFLHLANVDAGFRTRERMAVRIALPPSRYETVEESASFYRRLLDEVRAIPDVGLAAVATGLPLADPGVEAGIAPEGVPYARENVTLASVQVVSRDYFRTMGIDLLEGRVFDARDGEDSLGVAVVDERLARQLFPGESALGKRLAFSSAPEGPDPITIVGVVRHVLNYQLSAPEFVEIYLPLDQPPPFFTRLPPATLVVRSASAPETVFASLRRAVRRIDPVQPVFGATTFEELVDLELAPQRANGVLAASFAVAALVLAAVGLYGVLASIVALRTREVGVRVALGATSRNVLRLVVGEGLGLAVAGAVLGLLGALAAQRALAHLLHAVGLLELDVLAVSLSLVLLVSIVASAVPARRATRVDVVSALRHE